MVSSKSKTLIALTHAVEGITANAVKEGYAHYHDENGITNNLLMALRKELQSVTLTDLSVPTKILCEAYKYNGPLETEYGDIAVIVRVSYPDNTSLEGVGFLEAKKRNEKALNFAAFDLCQIQRIYANAPYSFVLMYDNKSITGNSKDVDIPYRFNCRACFPSPPIHTNAVVVANNIVIRAGKLNIKLYRNAIPFSYQLCFRYLMGFDLNFSRSTLESAERFASSLPRRFVIAIDVIRGDRPSDSIIPIQIDNDEYSVLTADLE